MTSEADQASEATDDMLQTFLRAQRESVLAIVEGSARRCGTARSCPRGPSSA